MGKRKTRSRRWLRVIAVVLLIAGYCGYALARPLPALNPSLRLTDPATPKTLAAVSWPSYGGQALGVAGYGVLARNGSDAPLATASIAKVMTALCVLQKMPIKPGQQGPTLTLTQDDVAIYDRFVAQDGSVVPVADDEQITEYQALQALLLPSANNIAESLARWAFGSVDAYNAYANSYAKKLKLGSITITDPSGLDGKTVGSPADLTLLGEIALQNETIRAIVSQDTATIPVAGTIRNVNYLLGRDGIIGIKTGNNDEDPGAFLFAAQQTIDSVPVTIVGTNMGAPDLVTALKDSLPLITAARDNLHHITAAKAGSIVGSYNVPWQGTVAIVAAQKLDVITWSNNTVSLKANARPVFPGTSGAVGTTSVRNQNGTVIATGSLRLSATIRQPSPLWRLTHPTENTAY